MASVAEEPLYREPMSSPSPVELRHITSNTNLTTTPPRERKLSNRISTHLRTHRLGSRSPASIPSSPTSVHSSSSAIFERDIEPINPSSPSLSIPSDPHRMPRGKFTEQLDQAVPTVLDSAAEMLATTSSPDDDLDTISIVAPAPPENGYQSGFTSPISRMSSRSPSPTGAGTRRSLLFSSNPLSGSPPIRPAVHTAAQPAPQATATPTPTSAYYSLPDTGSEGSSPTTATHTEHPLHSLQPRTSTNALSSHPPSPNHTANKRLSFISYIDLLTSTPASTLPLSSLTSSAVASEPPPHIPSVIGIPQAQAHHAAGSSAGSIHGDRAHERDVAAGMVDVGGEWEREGLGRGLEERLEVLMATPGKA